MMIHWENYRQSDGSLDLPGILLEVTAARKIKSADRARALEFLESIAELCPITSRQAGAIAIAHALEIATKGAYREDTHSFPPLPHLAD